MSKVACIYKIKSKCKPDRIYIGSSADTKRRWDHHISCLKLGKHHSHKLQNHYNKYGFEDLEFSIIAICEKEELIPINRIIRPEQFFIWAYDPWFNECKIAGSVTGKPCSEETKAKLRIARKYYVVTEETRRKQSEAAKKRPSNRTGIRWSEEAKQRISESSKNRPPISEETRKKLSDVHKGKKQSAEEVARKSERMKGHSVSEETRRKISISHKGKPLGELHRIRTIKALTGRPVSEETRRKISLKHKGRKVSEEAKEKMREVALKTGRKPPSRKGKSVPQEIRDKISEGMKRHKRLKDQNKNAA